MRLACDHRQKEVPHLGLLLLILAAFFRYIVGVDGLCFRLDALLIRNLRSVGCRRRQH